MILNSKLGEGDLMLGWTLVSLSLCVYIFLEWELSVWVLERENERVGIGLWVNDVAARFVEAYGSCKSDWEWSLLRQKDILRRLLKTDVKIAVNISDGL
ncbi:hypothetical protein VNO77_22704 [Canavalia gladiata]|uniref:Uncharacterized protein n=1 Tax=Canavalia gladiata TaxID=3824 RepID=A0AAN9QB14_CANGL